MVSTIHFSQYIKIVNILRKLAEKNFWKLIILEAKSPCGEFSGGESPKASCPVPLRLMMLLSHFLMFGWHSKWNTYLVNMVCENTHIHVEALLILTNAVYFIMNIFSLNYFPWSNLMLIIYFTNKVPNDTLFVGLFVFIEEDHYVLPDFIHMLNLMNDFRRSKCPSCSIFALGSPSNQNKYYSKDNFAEVTHIFLRIWSTKYIYEYYDEWKIVFV